MNEDRLRFSGKIVAEMTIFVALATALSYVRVFRLPQGGSVTAGSMVPIIWFSLRRGPKLGLFFCTFYGLVQLFMEPFIFHPLQVLLDYPIAFGMLGLAGFFQKRPVSGRQRFVIAERLVPLILGSISLVLFVYELTQFAVIESLFFFWLSAFSFSLFLWLQTKRKKVMLTENLVTPALIGTAVGVLGRFIAHFVSGVVFFGSYAPEGMSPIVYSAIYNGTYIIPELLVSFYLMYLVAKSNLLTLFK
ncbi:MAG: energy-coupled thiamine transporter ThiT [Candidatus Bathyarchaeota archaeon]|jgi:thiamine transporter